MKENKERLGRVAAVALVVLLAILPLLPISANAAVKRSKWHEGDIVFQISKSGQSPFIAFATQSPYTHCGIVVKKDGQWYVLEAHNGVELTPLKKWCNRGRFKRVKRRRYFSHPVKVRYDKYLGKRYDLEFSFDNDKYYCSELVWLIYKEQFGVELCKPKRVKDYNITGLRKIMRKRGIKPNQLVVAPCDLLQND